MARFNLPSQTQCPILRQGVSRVFAALNRLVKLGTISFRILVVNQSIVQTTKKQMQNIRALKKIHLAAFSSLTAAFLAGCASHQSSCCSKPTEKPMLFISGGGVGGGVITLTPSGISLNHQVYVFFTNGPQAAVTAGAQHCVLLTPTSPKVWSKNPCFQVPVVGSSSYIVEFYPITGWQLPTNNQFLVHEGDKICINADYIKNP